MRCTISLGYMCYHHEHKQYMDLLLEILISAMCIQAQLKIMF